MAERKPDHMRQRRNRPSTAAVLPHENPAREVPPLPMDRAWSEQAIAWWLSVWQSPMATQYEDSDLPALVQLAVFVDEFWDRATDNAARLKLATEIRLRGEQFGLSPAARARLGWKVASAPAARARQAPEGDGADPRSALGRQSNVIPLRGAS